MKEIRIDVTKQSAEELALAADTIVAGNPAKFIKRIPPMPECGLSNEEDEIVQLGLDSCGD